MTGYDGTLEMKEVEGRKAEPTQEGSQESVMFRETTKVISSERKGAHLLDILNLTLQLVNIFLMDHLVSRPPLQIHLNDLLVSITGLHQF